MRRSLIVLYSVGVVLGCVGCASRQPNIRLFDWQRGIGLESRARPGMTMYLWFYEWNMFDAVEVGQHTHGGYTQFERCFSKAGDEATLTSETMALSARAVRGGVSLSLTVTNRSEHDWPALAGIIPCFNPGPTETRNPQFANTNTYFCGKTCLERQHEREIHFNAALRDSIDQQSDRGTFVFSRKWPTSESDAMRGLLIRESTDGRWVTGIAWDDFLSAQGHNPWQCMHLCIRVGPLKKGQTRTIRGRIYLFEGDREDCLRRYCKDFE